MGAARPDYRPPKFATNGKKSLNEIGAGPRAKHSPGIDPPPTSIDRVDEIRIFPIEFLPKADIACRACDVGLGPNRRHTEDDEAVH
jgi:hypothetical protein